MTPQALRVNATNIFLHDQPLSWNGYTAAGAVDYPLSMYQDQNVHHFTLRGAQVIPEIDGTSVTLKLTESQRARAIAISNTQGGDGSTLLLTVKAGAMVDVAGNPNFIASDLIVSEHDDVFFPSLISAEMWMANGTLVAMFDEFIDVTPYVDKLKFDKMYLGNATSDRLLNLQGSTAVEIDGYQVTMTMPEATRVRAIEASGTLGGDGHAGYYLLDAGAAVDVAQNENPAHEGVIMYEHADDKSPSVLSASMNFSTGVLTITYDETIDLTPAFKHVNLSKVSVTTRMIEDGWEGRNGFENTYFPQINTTIHFGGVPIIPVGSIGTSTDIVEELDGYDMRIQVSESKRVQILKQSRMYLVNESQVPLDHNLEAGDINPYFDMEVVCLPSNHVQMRVRCFVPTPYLPSPTHYLFVSVDNGVGIDIAGNPILFPDNTRLPVTEIADTLRPQVTSGVLHLSTGVLVLYMTETIDVTPANYVNLHQLFIVNASSTVSHSGVEDSMTLNGATVTSTEDSVLVNITLSEGQRARLVAMSNTPGGDGTSSTLSTLHGGFRDLSSNLNIFSDTIPMIEIPDTKNPIVLSSILRFGTNLLLLNVSETIDCTPGTLVLPERLFLSEDGSSDRLIQLSQAQVVEIDGTLVTLKLDEATRVYALARSSTRGGDGSVLTLDANMGAGQDVAGNPTLAVTTLLLNEIDDDVPPMLLSVRLNLSDSMMTMRTTETILLSNQSYSLNKNVTSLKMASLYISNATLVDTASIGVTLNLDGRAAVVGEKTFFDYFEFTLLLEESLRVEVLKLMPEYRLKTRTETASFDVRFESSSYNHTMVMDVFEGAFQDASGLNVSSTYNVTIIVAQDVVRPTLLRVVVDFSGGYLYLEADETIDVTLISLNDLTLTPHQGAAPTGCFVDPLSMCNGTVLAPTTDSKIVTIQMSEGVRVAAQYSTLQLGNDAPLFFNLNQNALIDIAGNGILQTLQFNTSEVHDISQPHLITSIVHFGTRSMTLVFNETLDLTPASIHVNLNKLLLSNAITLNATTDIRMGGATVIQVDATTMYIELTERQRVALLFQSAAQHREVDVDFAGDGTSLFTNVEEGFVVDLRGNPSVSQYGMSTQEIDDLSVPFITSAILYLETGRVVIVSSETLDTLRTSTWSFSFFNNPNYISLVGGNILPTEQGGNMTIILTETTRVQLIHASGQPGGDGTATTFKTVNGGVTDLSGNPSGDAGEVAVLELPDTSPPSMESVALNYNDGTLTFTVSETARGGSLNLTHLFLINDTVTHWDTITDEHGNQNLHGLLASSFGTSSSSPGVVSLVGADTSFGTDTDDLLTLTLQLTERQRSAAIRLSSTPVGGDGSPIVLLALPGAFTDVALNDNLLTSLIATETYDVDPPAIIAVSIYYASGLIVFTADETIDAVPASMGGLSLMPGPSLHLIYVVDNSDGGTTVGQSGYPLYLSGAEMQPISQENTSMTVHLTETQRVQFHGISASRDSTPIQVVVGAGAFRDVSNNVNEVTDPAIIATEITDGTFPQILSASLNFSNGVMILDSTETLDVDDDNVGLSLTKFDLSLLRLVNMTGDVPAVDHTKVVPPGGVTLDGGTIVPLDGISVTLHMLEAKRVVALRISGTPGGDNTSTILDVMSGSFMDIAGNLVTSTFNIIVTEYPDIISPLVETAALDLGTGLLTLNFGETVDGQVTSIDLARGWMGFSLLGEPVMLLNVTTPLTERNTSLQFQVDETKRIHLVRLLQLPPYVNAYLSLPAAFAVDLAGNPSLYAPNITVIPTLDIIRPHILSFELNYSDGRILIKTSEEIDLTLPEVIDLSTIILRNTPTGINLMTHLNSNTNGHSPPTTYDQSVDSSVISLQLPESLRVYILSFSGTPGGDGGTAVVQIDENSMTDVALNSLVPVPSDPSAPGSLTLIEHPDVVRPKLIGVTLDYGVGHVVISASETIDATPSTLIQSSQLYISNTPGDFFLPLDGANVVAQDGISITLTLSEMARAGAIRLSGVPGGDGGGVLVDIGYGACQDMAGNLIAAATNLPVAETPDTIAPFVTSVHVLFSKGFVRLFVSETVSPPSSLAQSQMYFGNVRIPFYETIKVNVAATLVQAEFTSWGISLPIPTDPPLSVAGCHSSLCPTDTIKFYVKNMNSIRVDGENILSGTATSLMNMLKTYVCSTNDNTNNPIELRLTGLIPGVDYQLTTYHHSKVGTGASHNGMDLDIILSDGSGGTTTTRAHTGWYWSTSSTANVEDVTRVTTFTAGSDVVDNSFRGFTYQVALRFTMSGSGGAFRNLLPFNGAALQLLPPTAPRGPSEVEPTLDIPYQMESATLLTDAWNLTYPYVELQLTELQRVQFLEKSGQSIGGDGDDLVVDIYQNTLLDLAGNGVPTSFGIVVQEQADIVAPNITSVRVDFGTSMLIFNLTELVRIEGGVQRSDLSKIVFANTSKVLNECLAIQFINTTAGCRGVSGYPHDPTGTATYALNTSDAPPNVGISPNIYSNQIHIRVGEEMRVELLQMSSTLGGDHDILFMGLLPGFIKDLSGNPSGVTSLSSEDGSIVEIVDHVRPTASVVSLHLETGVLNIQFRETIDLTTYGINLSAIVLTNLTGGVGEGNSGGGTNVNGEANEIRLNGATTEIGSSSFVRTVQTVLTENQRSWSVLHSGTTGGDGVKLLLRLEANAFFDLSGNGNDAVGIAVEETADINSPLMTGAEIDYETGTLIIHFDETLKYDLDERWTEIYFHLHQMFLSNGTTLASNLPIDGGTTRFVRGDYVSLRGSTIMGYGRQAGTSVTLRLTEETRVQGIEMSGTKGGDSFYVPDGNFTTVNNVTTVEWNHTENLIRAAASKLYAAVRLVLTTGSVSDMSLNPIVSTDVVLLEQDDHLSPIITNVTIDFGMKLMYLDVSETLDITPLDMFVNLSSMHIANNTGDQFVSLDGAALRPVDTYRVTLIITEEQKLKAAAASATEPYGDEVPTLFELFRGALRDVAGNLMDTIVSMTILELPDSIPPQIVTATINYSTGVMQLLGDESILAVPSTSVVTSDISIVNDDITLSGAITLEQSFVTPISSQSVTIFITEVQRSRGVLISGTPGGDNTSTFLHFSSASVQDVFGNPINDTIIKLVEYPDVVVPSIINVKLFFDGGRLEITCDETILTQSIVVSNMYLANSTSSHDIQLTGSSVAPPSNVNGHDNVTITILLPESHRVSALLLSSQRLTTGERSVGDGTPLVLDVLHDAMYDPAGLDVPTTFGYPVDEIEDVVGPLIIAVEFHLGLGRLKLTLDETINFTLPTNPTRIQIRDVGDTESVFVLPANSLDGATLGTTAVMLVDERTRVDSIRKSSTSGGDGTALRLDFLSNALSDLVNNTNEEKLTISMSEIADTIKPVPVNGTIDLKGWEYSVAPTNSGKELCGDSSFSRCGFISITFSEILNISNDDTRFVHPKLIRVGVLPRTGTTNFGLLTLDPLPLSLELNSLNGVHFKTLTFAMTETLRIAIVRITNNGGTTTVTDVNAGAVRDVAFNLNDLTENVLLQVLPDVVRPIVVSCTLNYSTGILLLTFDETVDVPSNWETTTNLEYVAIQNVSGQNSTTFNNTPGVLLSPPAYDDVTYVESGSVYLSDGAILTSRDSNVVEIILSEVQRAQAIAMSGVLGGDHIPVQLDVFSPYYPYVSFSPDVFSSQHAFRDVATNPVVPILGIDIIEYPDIVLPNLNFININYMTGLLQFIFDETIDATPASRNIDLSQITILDWQGTNGFTLATHDGANVVEMDGTILNITLQPRQRWALLFIYDSSIELSAFTGYDIESPVRAIIQPLAFRDLANNTLAGSTNYLNVSDSGGSYVMRSITEILSNVGEGHIASYGYTKLFIFNGTGTSLGLVQDQAKLVPGDFNDPSQCGEFDARNASGAPSGEGVINGVIHIRPGGNRISFNAPNPSGKPYKLCYRFSDEPYKLFQTVRLTVKQVIGISILPGAEGSSERAVVDKEKPFVLNGFGIEDHDAVRFVPFGKEDNDDCTNSLPINTGGYNGDSVLNKIFRTTFVTPSALNKPHLLCVRFNKEPWALVKPYIFVRAARLESVGGAYRGALLNVQVPFVFNSDHISGYARIQNIQVGIVGVRDQAKWVYMDPFKHLMFGQSVPKTLCEQEPALGSKMQNVIRDTNGQSYGTSNFLFTESKSAVEILTLCYKFATEPFAQYTNVQLNVMIPTIATISSTIAVRDIGKRLIMTGTLTSTKDDLVKWVVPFSSYTPSSSSPCKGEAQGGQIPVMTIPLLEDFTKKTVDVLFNKTVESSMTVVTSWALCYKFGTGPYVYFDQHRLTVGHLSNVTALTSESQVVVTNSTLRYKAGGVGITDMDSAMFIRRCALSLLFCLKFFFFI